MRICLDLRRPADCGVGRVAVNVAQILGHLSSIRDFELVFLVTGETLQSFENIFPGVPRIISNSRFFSMEDMFELPYFLKDKIDVFWSNQFYISPFFQCPVITMIHDIWPVKFPQWLPNHDEVEKRHGSDVMEAAEKIVTHFENEMYKSLDIPAQDLYGKRCGLFDKYMFASMYLAAQEATVIVTCSNYSRHQITGLLPQYQKKLKLLSPFVRGQALAHVKPSLARDRILMVAKFDPRKNHRFFLSSLQDLFSMRQHESTVEVFIIGDVGYRTFGKDLMRLGKSLERHPHQISFTGSISERQLWEYYSSADLLVFPSSDEGFGLPLLEALEAGVPTLVSNRGALPEVGGAFAQYSSLASPATFASEMDKILRNKDEAFKRARHGQDYAARKYSFQAAVAQVEEVLSTIS